MNREKTARAMIRLAKELISQDDEHVSEPGSTNALLEQMANADAKAVAKGEFKVARSLTADALGLIGDAFARFLVGDREVALRQLKSIAKKPFEGDLKPLTDSGEYNKLYDDLATDLIRVIKKHLPV